jgi:phage baseplate assembly protein gpV
MKSDARAMSAHFGVPTHALATPYLARVTSVDDPDSMAKVKVELYNFDTDRDVAIWARVAVPFAGGDRGAFFIPSVGDEVVVVFVNGDPRAPVVVGSLWNGTDNPPESISGRVDRWTITGKAGTRIAIVEESDATATIECSTPAGVTLTMTDEAGGKVEIKCAGNTVTIDSSGVTVTAASKLTLNASTCDLTASMVNVNAAMSKFSGIVQCDTLISNTVVSSAYTPGAGNIW